MDDEAQTKFTIALDGVTVARLMLLAESVAIPPVILLSQLVRDLVADDFLAHADEAPVSASKVLN